MKGVVKSYSRSHGYGFVLANGDEYFFHAKDLHHPQIGSMVEFKAINTQKGKRATQIRRI